MKYNNNSENLEDWSIKKLKSEAMMLDDMIHGQNPCYGSHDIILLDRIISELLARGIEAHNKLTFN
jgi:hypothetical protein